MPEGAGQERNFIECVRSRRTPMSNIDDAVHSDLISHVSEIAVRVGRKITWDHVHKIEDIFPYEFESAGDLLMDFWAAVDEALN